MSAGCARFLLSLSSRTIRNSSSVYSLCLTRRATSTEESRVSAILSRSSLCTTAEEASAPTKKKQAPSRQSFNVPVSSVGRKIPHRLIQVLGESGDHMGTMHRADVLKLMDEQGLKLVLLSDKQEPPVYRLMSGKEIHQEQLRSREKIKAKAAPIQVKELTFSSGIATHDLTTKLKQVESWLQKKHHVKVTLRASRGSKGEMDSQLESLVQQMTVDFGFVSKPKAIRDGRAAMCVLRLLSAKELAQKHKKMSDSDLSASLPGNTKDQSESPVPQ